MSWQGHTPGMHDYRIYAHFSYSAPFMLFGAVLLVAGFLRRSPFVRWQALVLLAMAIGKLFLIDASKLSQGYLALEADPFVRTSPQLADLRLYRDGAETPYATRPAVSIEAAAQPFSG